jgi:hypothetical protein
MPRLLRMPVFYLALLIALAGWAGVRAVTRTGDGSGGETTAALQGSPSSEPDSVESTRPDAPVEPIQAPLPAPAVAAGPPEPVLLTPEGLRRKVLVRELGVRCTASAAGGAASGPFLDYFSIHFLRGESPPGDSGRLEIGPASGPALGWVSSRDVLEWDSRLMAVPTPRRERTHALSVYRERPCLLAALAGRACEAHRAGPCPVEAEEPAGDDASEAETPLLGMPILQSVSIPQPDGSTRTIHEVAVLVRDLLPLPAPTEPPPEWRQPLRHVDLAFCVDTTQSMTAPIAAVKQFARQLAEEAPRRDPGLVYRLALVEYRDRSPVFGFVTRRVSDFATPDAFLARLDALAAAPRGDDSLPEAVLDGLAAALPGEGSQLSWPVGEVAGAGTRLLVLVGDAPDHSTDPASLEALAQRARDAGISIAALRIEPTPARRVLGRSDRQRLADQWRTLAEQSYRGDTAEPLPPLDLSITADPSAVDTAAVGSIAQQIGRLVDQRVAAAVALAALRQEEAEAAMRDYRTAADLAIEAVAPVLVDSHRTEARPTARPDPRRDGVKAPSLRRGWIAERIENEPLVRLRVLMSRPELDRLVREFLAVQGTATAGPDEVASLLEAATAAASGETGFLDADRGAITFDEHLARQQGLPPGRPDSLLRRTRKELLQADDLTRSALADRLSRAVGELVRFRESLNWSDPSHTVGGMALVPYDWIDL